MKKLHLFIHIPKTGGTSFKRSVIDRNIPRDEIFKYSGFKRFFIESHKDHSFIEGHLPFGLHHFTRKKCIYYTILREPIDHAISYYYFIRQCDYPNYKHPKLGEAKSLGLIDFTKRNKNPQCMTLAGIPWNRFYSRNSRQILRLAKKHLFHSCEAFGVLEYIEKFETEISELFGWTHEPIYEESKRTKDRPKVSELSKSEINRLRQILSLDIELYNSAKKKIEQNTSINVVSP